MIEPKTPGLIFEEEPHEYSFADRKVVSVTQALHEAGIAEVYRRDPVYLERGRLVHLMCHLFDQDRLDMSSVDPALAPYFMGWPKFCLDHDWEPMTSECPLGHTFFSPLHWFAGTPDKYGLLAGKRAIVEIKTGATPPWVGLQIAGQEILLRAAKVIPQGAPVRRVCVTLPGDGNYKITPFTDPTDPSVFLSAVAIANWKRR